MTKKFLLIEERQKFIPGDERSQRYPGHGYPAETFTYPVNTFFDSEQELLAHLEKNDIKSPTIYKLDGTLTLNKKVVLTLN